MPSPGEILLDGTGVSYQASETFFPEEKIAEAEGSDLETSSSFNAAVQSHQNLAKRVCGNESEICRLEAEVQRLQNINRYLQCSIHFVQNKTKHAKDQQIRLRGLVGALHSYKNTVSLQPFNEACWKPIVMHSAGEEDPTETFMTFGAQASVRTQPSLSAFGTRALSKNRKNVQSTSSNGATSQDCLRQKLPMRLEKNGSTAHAAAVAAAALSANDGQPAAALLDLLQLASKKRLADNKENELALHHSRRYR